MQPAQPMHFAAKSGKRPHPPVWSPQNRTRPTRRPLLRAVFKKTRLADLADAADAHRMANEPASTRWVDFVASTRLSQSVRSRCTGLPIPNGAAT